MVLWWLGLVSMVGSVALAGCPQHCSCFTDPDGYVSANCSVEALSSSGQGQHHVEMLNFQPRLGGYPTHFTPRAFVPFRSAKFLWMVNCSILELPKDVFHGLIYVIRLDLSYNKIRRLNGAVFEPMKSLTSLKLRSNPLELTPWDAIVSDTLQELDLGQCGLRTIPFGTFTGLPRLSRLYLDGNHLRTLTYSTVAPNLRYINLARNRISEVPHPVLSSLIHLRKLDLSKNPINCTCNLVLLQDWFSGQGIIFDNGVICVEPSHYKGIQLSKVSEYELCSMEEVQRQRKINEIRSFGDSKQHRVHNMIRDPDIQSDQPDDGNDAEILFENEDLGLTHMEMNRHYAAHNSDISGENNKVADSKQFNVHDLLQGTDHEEETSNEFQPTIATWPHHSGVEWSIAPQNATIESQASETAPGHHSLEEWAIETRNTTDNELSGNSSALYLKENVSSSTESHELRNASMTTRDELVDEGYSPVYNFSDIMLSDEGEGSGDELADLMSVVPHEEHNGSSTIEPYNFPSPRSDAVDYSYDSQHDYSAEVTGSTTESMSVLLEEEGSGEPENETAFSSTANVWKGESHSTESHFSSTAALDLEISASSSSSEPSSSDLSNIFPVGTSTELSISVEPSSTTSSSPYAASSESWSTSTESSSSVSPMFPVISTNVDFGMDEEGEEAKEDATTPSALPSSPSFPPTSPTPDVVIQSSPPSVPIIPSTEGPPSSSPLPITLSPVEEIQIVKHTSFEETKGRISAVGPAEEDRPIQSTATYVIAGLLVALIVVVLIALACKRGRNRKKVRLPKDMEASPGTELQDMLLPRPAENGVKIISTNGKTKEEEEKEALSKDWDDKNEPIETVTARLSVIAGPQTPVFIHKTLA